MSERDQVEEPLLSIGTFSRASLLSVKALRLYHEQGILVPALVDPQTGYRSYHPGQLADAAVLARLRQLDLPLPEAKEILLARDPEVTRKILAAHQARMEDRLTETERIVAELQAAADAPSVQTPVHVRVEPHAHALAVTGEVAEADFGLFLGRAYGMLYPAVLRHFTQAGAAGALYVPEIHDDRPQPVTAYVPIETPGPIPTGSTELEVIELPERPMAVIAHHGPYETVGSTYAALGAWVAGNATPSGDPVRELYLVSVPHTDDPDQYVTEICWPIEKGQSP